MKKVDRNIMRGDDYEREAIPFEHLKESGLVWLINRAVFHPRGFSFAVHMDREGKCMGWSVDGDGTEPWSYDRTLAKAEEERFRAVEAFFDNLRPKP